MIFHVTQCSVYVLLFTDYYMSHAPHHLYPLSSCMHVCTGGDLLRACSYSSMQGGRNAFHLCATSGHLAVAQYLAHRMEGHLFDSDDDGSTILHLAANFGQLSMVKYLMRSCGFDVKTIDKVGPLCCCSVSFSQLTLFPACGYMCKDFDPDLNFRFSLGMCIQYYCMLVLVILQKSVSMCVLLYLLRNLP